MGRDGDLAQGDAVTRKARSAQRVPRKTCGVRESESSRSQGQKGADGPDRREAHHVIATEIGPIHARA